MAALLPKQVAFCHEYLKDLNGHQAAIRAGYSPKTAHVQASRLLSYAKVKNLIGDLMEVRNEETLTDAAYILRRLREMDELDIIDIINDDLSFKKLVDWPKPWRQSLSALDVQEIIESGNDGETITRVLKKVKWPDKPKILEMMGKHVDVQAFREQQAITQEVTGPNGGPIVTHDLSDEEFKKQMELHGFSQKVDPLDAKEVKDDILSGQVLKQ